MGRIIIGASGLAVLWLLMSGIYDNPLILIFGVISVGLSIWIGIRMDHADGEKLPIPLGVFATTKYLFWLLVEIAKSNWAVTKVILSGKPPQRQKFLWTPVTQKSDVAQVVFANSITLTPGTVTVESEGNHFLVHAIDFAEGDMEALAEMDAQVSTIETAVAGDDK